MLEGSHRQANKTQHNYIFAAWLVKTFGQHDLRQGRGVLDIAGGNGGVSFELSVRYGIPSTLLEMRSDIQLSSMARRRMKRIHNHRCHSMNLDQSPMLKHLILHDLAPQDDGVTLPDISTCFDSHDLPFTHFPCKFPEYLSDLVNDPELISLVQNASILVGVHPDEATEAIVDTALHFKIPFAIVPCCLHSSLYPHRMLPINRAVNSYDLFIEYLAAKHTNIQRVRLPFEGRNICLYCIHYNAT